MLEMLTTGFCLPAEWYPVLQDTEVRSMGRSSMPTALSLSETNLLNWVYDGRLVRLESRLVDMRTKGDDLILVLQTGSCIYEARLAATTGFIPSLPPGSRLALTGIYSGKPGRKTAAGPELAGFELLLNSATNIVVLERPPWWTLSALES